MVDYEVHQAAGDYLVKTNVFDVALKSVSEMSLLEPEKIFFVSRVEPFDRATLCVWHRGCMVNSFLNRPMVQRAEA